MKINIKDKKCRYCGEPAVQGQIITTHAFPFTGSTYKRIHYYCDNPIKCIQRKETN